MGLFRRKKKSAPGVATIPGVPVHAMATEDFEVVIRSIVAELTGEPVTELGDDTIGAAGGQTYLGNFRAGWNAREPGERELWLRNAMYGLYRSELRDTSSLDTSMLRPGIRSMFTVNFAMLMGAAQQPGTALDPSAQTAHRPMADGIARVLIWDTPTTMQPLAVHQLAEWGVDFDDLWDIAVANLAADPFESSWKVANDCVWISTNEDDYTAERMFMNGFAESTQIAEPVMFHPHRNLLMVADRANPESLGVAAAISLQQAQSPNPVSLTPIAGNGLSWEPLVLPADHPAAPLVDQLRLLEASKTYDTQQQILSQIHGEDIFVATFKAYNVDGGTTSIATWTEGADSLLPTAREICFVVGPTTENPETIIVGWSVAESVVGHHMEPTAYYPARTRVMTFPNAQELDELRKHSAPRS